MPRGGPRRAAVRARLVELVERGGDPLAFLAGLVADPNIDLPTRLHAAEVLLPYCAPRQNGRPTRVEKAAAKTVEPPL